MKVPKFSETQSTKPFVISGERVESGLKQAGELPAGPSDLRRES